MMNDAAAQTGNSVMGKWIARDENKAVKVEFDRDGSMEIEWLQGVTSSTEWEGFWTSTDTEITFTVRSKETETWTNGSKKETRESMNAVWKLQYTRNDDNTLTLRGSDLPKELANLTLSRRALTPTKRRASASDACLIFPQKKWSCSTGIEPLRLPCRRKKIYTKFYSKFCV